MRPKVLIAILVSTAALASIYAVKYLGHEKSGKTSDDLSASAEKTHEHPKETLYICPMHPQITSNQPGQTCPICGMDLVPADQLDSPEDAATESDKPRGLANFNLNETRRQLIGVKTAKVVRKKLFKTINAPGRAAFDPELYTVQAEYQQALEQMARIKDSPLSSVKTNVQRMLDSAKVRLKVLGLSNSQIDAIKPNQDISESLLVYEKGGQVWIYADVFEMDLRNIEKGQSAQISANYLEGLVIPAIVSSTDQIINPETRTAKVRIKVTNSPVKLRPESFVDVKILAPQGEHIAIPLDAVVDTGQETYVFVIQTDGQFQPRRINIAFRAGSEVAVKDGLTEGEEIVTSGNFLVNSESQLKGVLESMINANHPNH